MYAKVMKLNSTMASFVVLHSASVHIPPKVKRGMIDVGPTQEDIQFVNLSDMSCKFSAFDGRNCSGPS